MDKKLLLAKPVAKELENFVDYYRSSISSENPRIQEIIEHMFKSDGKRIRPILLLLAAKACGEVNNVTYNAAVTIELLHTASLIHDDVVDESKIRRGKASLNAVYDNKIAVLAGDYFLSTALIKSVMTGNLDIISDISALGRSLAEGELNQLVLVRELILDEKEYFEVIRKKTASLLSICMKLGAESVGASEDRLKKYAEIGELFGMCFQLKDDIFDYFHENVGKPTGNDIREGKVTLPLLFAISQANKEEMKNIEEVIFSYDYTDENIEKLIKFAQDKGGIDYAYSKIYEYREKAKVLIDSEPDSEVKTALYDAMNYIVERVY